MTGVIMFMRHERQTWRILAQYKCPLLLIMIKLTVLQCSIFFCVRVVTIKADHPTARVGSTVRLNCSFTATINQSNTASDIVWTHNATNLVGVRNQTLDAVSAQLILEDVQFDSSGAYSCCLGKAAVTYDAITDSASINIHVGCKSLINSDYAHWKSQKSNIISFLYSAFH